MFKEIKTRKGESILLFLLLAGILLLGIALRSYNLGEDSLWGDEVFTARAGNNLHAIVFKYRVAPLYVMTYFFLFIGENEFIIRWPHVLVGMLSIPLMYKVGQMYFGKRIGFIGAFLLSISPLHISFSQDARFYSLMAMLPLLSLLFLKKALTQNKRKWQIAFVLTSILNIHNHSFAFIIVGAQVIYAYLIWRWTVSHQNWGRFFDFKTIRPKKVLACLFLLSPIVFIFFILNPLIWRHIILRQVQDSSFDLELNAGFFEHLLFSFGAGPGLPAYIYLLLFVAGMLAAWLYCRRAFTLLTTIFFATLAALQLLVWIGPAHPFYLRYIIFLLPFYLLAVATGLDFGVGVIVWLFRQITAGAKVKPLSMSTTAVPVIIAVFVFLNWLPLQNYYSSHLANC